MGRIGTVNIKYHGFKHLLCPRRAIGLAVVGRTQPRKRGRASPHSQADAPMCELIKERFRQESQPVRMRKSMPKKRGAGVCMTTTVLDGLGSRPILTAAPRFTC